jgi:hypothetical protein
LRQPKNNEKGRWPQTGSGIALPSLSASPDFSVRWIIKSFWNSDDT